MAAFAQHLGQFAGGGTNVSANGAGLLSEASAMEAADARADLLRSYSSHQQHHQQQHHSHLLHHISGLPTGTGSGPLGSAGASSLSAASAALARRVTNGSLFGASAASASPALPSSLSSSSSVALLRDQLAHAHSHASSAAFVPGSPLRALAGNGTPSAGGLSSSASVGALSASAAGSGGIAGAAATSSNNSAGLGNMSRVLFSSSMLHPPPPPQSALPRASFATQLPVAPNAGAR
jgi:hypothetical protein